MAARSKLGRMFERGYNRSGAVNLNDVVAEIHARAGSDRKAAAMVGVHHRTWQRWRKGEAKPNAVNLLGVGTAVRQVRADKHPLNVATWEIKTKGKDGRDRTIRGSQLGFSAAQIDAIQRAYVDGGADAAGRAFMRELATTPPGRDWYHEYFSGLDRDGEEYDDLLDLMYEGSEDDMDAYSAGAVGGSW